MKQARKALSPTQIQVLTHQLIEQARPLADLLIRDGKIAWGVFCPLSFEPQLLDFWRAMGSRGVKLHFPRLILSDPGSPSSRFDFVPLSLNQIQDPSCWQPGRFNLQEPHPRFPALERVGLLQAIWIPGVAFGPKGERIGNGQGYYDQTLAEARETLRVGLGFDFQFHPHLPQNHWDLPMNWIVTDQRRIQVPAEVSVDG